MAYNNEPGYVALNTFRLGTYVEPVSYPYNVLTTDCMIGVDTSGGARTIRLPNTASVGRVYIVKDRNGVASTNNITITTVGGVVLLDGSTSVTINTNRASYNFFWNGSAWFGW